MPPLSLTPDAVEVLEHYPWPGNIRQLKNTTEQMSILEVERQIDADTLLSYLPESHRSRLPIREDAGSESTMNEREILYKVLFDMRQEMQDLKQLVYGMMQSESGEVNTELASRIFNQPSPSLKGLPLGRDGDFTPEQTAEQERAFSSEWAPGSWANERQDLTDADSMDQAEEVEEVLSLQDSEKELIRRALQKHRNRRKYAALELGISERTLYRKIKEYGLK
jgi:DNA-binding NtrC family response regulator